MPDKKGKNKKYKNAAAEGIIAGVKKNITPVSEIKSNLNFATPGTEFKATKPGTSNQQSSTNPINDAVNSFKTGFKQVKGGLENAPSFLKDISSAVTGAAGGLMAKSPYMMYGKKSDIMMSESPLAKYGCSKKYKKGK